MRTFVDTTQQVADTTSPSSNGWEADLAAHKTAVETALVNLTPLNTEPITTKWRNDDAPMEETTHFAIPESKQQWLDRHFVTVHTQMALYPPGG